MSSHRLSRHLRHLQDESIHVLREAVAEFARPVMLYSIGKDSSVMLHLALKAFYPTKPPFPLLHVDTTWKFRDMIAFRDETASRLGLELLVHVNRDGLARGVSPVASCGAVHTHVMKTEALLQAFAKWNFDAAFGGARRDEERSRAKERIFSHRGAHHAWEPRNQRPELWNVFNTRIAPGESMRIFPLSNWTELDVWDYILAEDIPVVPRPPRRDLDSRRRPPDASLRGRDAGAAAGALPVLLMDPSSGQPVAVRPFGAHLPTLRFLTCGSVDDGKSTLIGRLLYDRNLVYEDHLAALARDSRRHGTTGDALDLALLMDGLEAEREQGITIDVAYRYFATEARTFIVADCPGHEQYTRNMATGASNAELAILLVDARKGLLPQTRRHATIASLLGIRHVVLAVNKMDLVGYERSVFDAIADTFRKEAAPLRFHSIAAIPLSARFGDNVCATSANIPWHDGPSLLAHLERIDVGNAMSEAALRFPVQWVNRPHLDFRGFAGTVASGRVAVGDTVAIAPSGRHARISRIVTMDGDLAVAETGQAVTIVLADDIDVSRGDVLSHVDQRPTVADQFAAHLVWMGEEKMLPGRSYWLKSAGRTVPAVITEIKHRLHVDNNAQLAAKSLSLNEIGFCNLAVNAPLVFDRYADNRTTGAFALIDRATNATVAAGMIAFPLRRAGTIVRQALTVDRHARARLKGQKPVILWFTGLSGSGKSTVANAVEARLLARNAHTTLLDGDNLRHGLNRDLGFTDADRVENIRRVGEVAKLMVEAGLIVLCSFISPFAADRHSVRDLVEAGDFVEIFIDAPLELCIARDPKGLYRRALAGEIRNFTGIDQPYEVPTDPDLRFQTGTMAADDIAARIVEYLEARRFIEPL